MTSLFHVNPFESLSVCCVTVSQALQISPMPQQRVEQQRALKAVTATAQVDAAASNGTQHPPLSEADLKEAWLASCRALYEVQNFPPG